MKFIICAVTVLLSFGPASTLFDCYDCSTSCSNVPSSGGTAANCGACGTTTIIDNVAVRTARRVCYPTMTSCTTAEASAATTNAGNAAAGSSSRTTVTCCGSEKCNNATLPDIGATGSTSASPASTLFDCYDCSTSCSNVPSSGGTAANCGACGTTTIIDDAAVRTARRVCYPTMISCTTAKASAATTNAGNAAAGSSSRTTVTCCGSEKCNNANLPDVGPKSSGGIASSISPTIVGLLVSLFLAYSNL